MAAALLALPHGVESVPPLDRGLDVVVLKGAFHPKPFWDSIHPLVGRRLDKRGQSEVVPGEVQVG